MKRLLMLLVILLVLSFAACRGVEQSANSSITSEESPTTEPIVPTETPSATPTHAPTATVVPNEENVDVGNEEETEPTLPDNVFSIKTVAEASEGGIVTGGGNYEYREQCNLEAIAHEGWEFSHWELNGAYYSRSNPIKFFVVGNETYTAFFNNLNAVYTIEVNAQPAEGGTVKGGGQYKHGDSFVIEATPNHGWEFAGWVLNGTMNITTWSREEKRLADSNETYTAKFKPVTATPTPSPTVEVIITPTVTPMIYTQENWNAAKVGDRVKFGKYEQDNNTGNGAESIEWYVIDEEGDCLLLYCSTALASMPFNEKSWEDSKIRSWLNGEFYETAFSQEEAKKIVKIQNDNWFIGDEKTKPSKTAVSDIISGDDTMDNVFLPSSYEYENLVTKGWGWRTATLSISEVVKKSGFDLDDAGQYYYTPFWSRTIAESGIPVCWGIGEDKKNYRRNYWFSLGQRCLVYPAIWVSKEETTGVKTCFTNADVFEYKETKDGIIVCGLKDKKLTQIYIPEYIAGKKVVEIAPRAFADCAELLRIKIPENVKRVAYDAFSGCDNLVDIFFPSTLEELDTRLLENTKALKQITCAKGIKKEFRRELSRYRNKDIWSVIENDVTRWGAWDLTYMEYIEMYFSIGTENDLFVKMLKEKGPSHTEDAKYFEFDGLSDLDISFPDVLTEKIYALHYAPFEYNTDDLLNGVYRKDALSTFQDHGGVCGVLANIYEMFIRDILCETDWKYCCYGNESTNHGVLLVQTEDGKVFQIDNGGVDYWWLGIEFRPDSAELNAMSEDYEIKMAFEKWEQEFMSLENVQWHTFTLLHSYDYSIQKLHYRPVWFDYATEQFETYYCSGIPQKYTVLYRGLQDKVISMAGYYREEGYVNLSELSFSVDGCEFNN